MGDRLRVGKLSRYVTSHLGQFSLAIPLWVGAMSTSLGWEGNRRSGIAPVVRHRHSGLSTYRLNGIWKGDEHPIYTPLEYTLPLVKLGTLCNWFCLFVCLSVSRITAEVTSWFHWNLMLWFDLLMGSIYYLSVVIRSWIWIPDCFPLHLALRKGHIRFVTISQSPATFHNSVKWLTPKRKWIHCILEAIWWTPDLRCGSRPPTRLGRVSVCHLPQWCGHKLYCVQPMQAMGPQEV